MAGPYPQIVLLGDSLMQKSANLPDGYSLQAALQSRFIRRFDVVNRGFSGWNSVNLLKYLPELFPLPTEGSAKIKYLAILIGANDAAIPIETNGQHVPLAQYKENLAKIIRHPHIEAHKPKIILVTPPPVNQLRLQERDTAAGHARAIRQSATSASYSEAARQVASEIPGVALVDLWKGIMDKAISMAPTDYVEGGPWLGSPENGKAGGLAVLLHDGLHMNGDAYKVFYDLLVSKIDEPDEETAFATFEGYVFPVWQVLNPPRVPLGK